MKFWQALSISLLFASHEWFGYKSKIVMNVVLIVVGYVPILCSKHATLLVNAKESTDPG